MDIVVNNQVHITDPNKDILDYIKFNLVVNNPDYDKKVRMGFWVGNTPPKLYLYEKNGNEYVVPYGCVYEVMKRADCQVKSDFTNHPILDYECEIPLYDYQQIAVTEMFKARHGILQAPAGCGKTQMGLALARRYRTRTLWITHTKDLLKQSFDRLALYMDKDLNGTITEGKIDIGNVFTFATIQTLANIDLERYRDKWDVIIVDECHRVAGSPTSLTMFYKVLSKLRARHKYGLSATVHRSDQMIRTTFALLGNVKYAVPEEAVGNKILKVGILPRGTRTSISEDMLNTDGTLNYTAMITALGEDKHRNEVIVNDIIDNKDKSCLILSDRIEHLETMLNMLPEDLQQQAILVHGKMTNKAGKLARENAMKDMREGRAKYLFASYSLAKEGLDIPRLERLFMATPIKDYAVVVQSVGRIARAFEGKADPIVYDYIDNIPFLLKAYKKRWSSYRKINCYEVDYD